MHGLGCKPPADDSPYAVTGQDGVDDEWEVSPEFDRAGQLIALGTGPTDSFDGDVIDSEHVVKHGAPHHRGQAVPAHLRMAVIYTRRAYDVF